MIIDITGIELHPGNHGSNCKGNGLQFDDQGIAIECCCDECDYYLCCLESHNPALCKTCTDQACPNRVI